MMPKVTSLDAYRPHYAGDARCTGCRHCWQAVVPVSDRLEWLECPACGRDLGRLVGHFSSATGHFLTCPCGNDLFRFTSAGEAYCPACGGEGPR